MRPATLSLELGAPLPELAAEAAPKLYFNGSRSGAIYLRELMQALEQPGLVVLESLSKADHGRVERLLASVDKNGQGRATLLGPEGYGQVAETFQLHPEAELIFIERTLAPLDAPAPELAGATDEISHEL